MRENTSEKLLSRGVPQKEQYLKNFTPKNQNKTKFTNWQTADRGFNFDIIYVFSIESNCYCCVKFLIKIQDLKIKMIFSET